MRVKGALISSSLRKIWTLIGKFYSTNIHITYGLSVWGNTTDNFINRIFTLQKKGLNLKNWHICILACVT